MCIKSLKMCLKSDFKEIYLKLATNGQSDKAFLFTSKCCLQGVVCPCPWAVYEGLDWGGVCGIL